MAKDSKKIEKLRVSHQEEELTPEQAIFFQTRRESVLWTMKLIGALSILDYILWWAAHAYSEWVGAICFLLLILVSASIGTLMLVAWEEIPTEQNWQRI